MKLKVIAIGPGLILTLAIAVFSRWLHGFLPGSWSAVLGEVVIGLSLGLIIGNLWRPSLLFKPGLEFSFCTVLKIAIVLLGARLSLQQVMQIGGKAVLLITLLILLALMVAHLLGRLTGVSGKLSTLIGVGTAICGNTAITVTAPVIKARDEEVSFAIGANTLIGTTAVFLYPVLGHQLGLSDTFFGTWAGVAVNDTSQVVATGFAYSEQAGELATAVKLTRNALMGFVIVAIGYLYSKGSPNWERMSLFGKIRSSIPGFVIGFLVMAVLNSLGVFDRLSDLINRPVLQDMTYAAKFLILVALTGVGFCTRLNDMRKIGLAPFVLALAAALSTSLVSYFVIRAFW